jgi:hypothetical protein
MEVNAYCYVEDQGAYTYCFKCAVKAVIAGTIDTLDLVLKEGSTGDGNDMRSTPECAVCGRTIRQYCIA